MARFRLLCKAARPGFYGDRMHYPATGPESDHKRAGFAFALLEDALRYDAEGKMEVDKDLKPILPSWVLPQEELKPINPKETPHVIVSPRKQRMGKRNLPKGVRDVAPKAWPENVQPKDHMDPDRVVRIKKAGATAVQEEDED